MSVNGVTSSINTYDAYQTSQSASAKAAEETTSQSGKSEDSGVVYEPSNDTAAKGASKKTYTQNTELVNKMKQDAANRAQQLQDIVQKLLTQQGKTYNNANDIWRTLAGGDFQVDAATKAQAQADIAEDGYWGVKQTSERILDFATALTGGDPDKIEEMREAFKKGYKMAEKTWGGELPEISRQTYDAVMAGFDKMAEEAGLTTSSTN